MNSAKLSQLMANRVWHMVTKIRFYFSQHPLIFISIVYFSFRLIHLTKLPIFNDEAIYMDWAWRMTNEPGELFYSLYDAKQPLLMWVFGIFQHILPNPFFAARFVSVLCGWVTLIGIYKIGKTYFSKKSGLLASLLYIVVPIFSFYDRQALMEAGVGAVGIWVLWSALNLWKKSETKHAIYIGILLGIGFFIKSSAIIFLLSFFILSKWFYYKKHAVSIRQLIYCAGTFLCVISLLLLQPKFWETLSSNSRYGYGLSGLLHFPISSWVANLFGNFEIALTFFTPIVFLASIAGIIILLKRGNPEQKNIALWIVVILLLQILVIRSTSQRYLVSYLPPLVLTAAFFAEFFVSHYKRFRFGYMIGWVVLLAVPILLTLVQLSRPILYFTVTRVSRFSEGAYVSGRTSGYGIDDAIRYIERLPNGNMIFVGESLYTGTPESAVMVWFERNKFVRVGYLDRRLLGDNVDTIDCIKTDVPVYFLSKDRDVAGLEKFLTNVTFLRNPYNQNIIGIWKMKDKCEGKSMQVRLVNIK